MSEGKIRFGEPGGHTVLYNSLVRDPRLSLKTVGLLAVMKSLINTEWGFSVSGMAKYCRVGKDAIRNCLKELEEAGYLTRERTHNDDGTFGGNEYVIFETTRKPLEADVSDHRRENPTMDKTQRRVKPSSDNQTQIKEITQVKENKNPPISPQGDVQADVLFDRFWAAYPRKVNKDRARRAWKKLRPDLALCRVMSAALAAQKASTEWTRDDGRYIPHAATWLNGRRWEDEVEPAAQAGAPPAPPAAPRKSHVEVINGEEVVVFD